jgi:hypothetical protein
LAKNCCVIPGRAQTIRRRRRRRRRPDEEREKDLMKRDPKEGIYLEGDLGLQ